MSNEDPIRQEFIRRTLERDFKTIIDRQRQIAQERVYYTGHEATRTQGTGRTMQNRTGRLAAFLGSAQVRLSPGSLFMAQVQYPLYIRFLDMKRLGNFKIYNRQLWGVIYNETLPELKHGLDESMKEQIRRELEQALGGAPGESRNGKRRVGLGYRPH